LTLIDRGVLAAYCQSYGSWVEAERKLAETPPLLKTPGGYVYVDHVVEHAAADEPPSIEAQMW
jgi:hypothetical protein